MTEEVSAETLQTMTTQQAIKSRTKVFLSARECKDCGSKVRWLPGWFKHKVVCAMCYPQEDFIKDSYYTVQKQINEDNAKFYRKDKELFFIPVVIGGIL